MKRLLVFALLLFLLVGSASATITANTSYAGGYTTVTFTSNNVSGNLTDISTYVLATDATQVEWLVIGGGGAGANGHVGGGGGAGGYLTNAGNATSLSAGTYNISIGIGGKNATSGSYTNVPGNGTFSCFQNIIAYGGGRGGMYDSGAGSPGGSGGGGAYTAGVGGANVTGQGFPGGTATGTAGGGAGANTQNRTQVNTGRGGDGAISAITGSAYAGGGAGGSLDAGNKTGGFGGGGRGGTNGGGFNVGEAGKANTGSGGGGGGISGQAAGGAGANGIIVLKYLPTTAAVSASFTQDKTYTFPGGTVSFTDTSTGSPDSYNWSVYPTGASPTTPKATSQNFAYMFSNGGNYTINLTVTNGGTSTKLGYVDVWNITSGDFAANDTTGVMTLAVLFTPTVFNTTTYNWSFGDGNVSTSASPTHTYNALGTFDVKLYISNGHDNMWINKTGYITVSTTPVPAADFSGTPVTGIVPLNVTFTDSSTESPTEWNYSFGDGNYSHLQNPVYRYLSAGTYTVSLNATNAGGSNTNTKAAYITVSPMTASFAANDTSGTNPTAIQFTGSSTGVADTWYWEFGDGNTSALQNPVFVYGVNGTFNVNMRATNLTSGASDWENKTGYITITQVSNGYNQQDIYLDPTYTVRLRFTDSTTAAPVVGATVVLGASSNTTDSSGYVTFWKGYELTSFVASASGYYGTSGSFVVDQDTDRTYQMVPLTESVQNTNTVYTQHFISFRVVDMYRRPLSPVTVTAYYVNSSLPAGSNVAYLTKAFGIDSTIASSMLNSSVALQGVTGTDGKIGFVMFPAIQYTVQAVNGTMGAACQMTAYPTDSDYLLYCPLQSQSTVTNNTATQIAGSYVWITEPNNSYVTFNAQYQDPYGITTDLWFNVTCPDNQTVLFQDHPGNPGTTVYAKNFTLPNVRGTQVNAYLKYNRSA